MTLRRPGALLGATPGDAGHVTTGGSQVDAAARSAHKAGTSTAFSSSMTSAIFAGKILQAWRESTGEPRRTGEAGTPGPPPPSTHRGLPHGRVLQAVQDLHGGREVPLLVAQLRDQQELGQQVHLQLHGGGRLSACGYGVTPGPLQPCESKRHRAPLPGTGGGRDLRAGRGAGQGWHCWKTGQCLTSIKMDDKVNLRGL